jgi:hypothetical protein
MPLVASAAEKRKEGPVAKRRQHLLTYLHVRRYILENVSRQRPATGPFILKHVLASRNVQINCPSIVSFLYMYVTVSLTTEAYRSTILHGYWLCRRYGSHTSPRAFFNGTLDLLVCVALGVDMVRVPASQRKIRVLM